MPRNCIIYCLYHSKLPRVSVSGVISDRPMTQLLDSPKNTKVLALAPSVSSAPRNVLDQMEPDAPLLLSQRLALDCLCLPFDERPDLGLARGLFRGVNVVDDPLAVHVPRERVVPGGLDPVRIRLLALPSFVEEIAAEAFRGWQMLEVVSFADDSRLRIIGQGAFRDSGLSSFAPPASLRVLGREALAGCRKLSHLVLNEGLQELGERCLTGAGLNFLAFPEHCPMMGSDVFAGCSHIRTVRLPTEVTRKLVEQLAGAGMEVAYVPAGTEKIPEEAFRDTPGLRRVVFLGQNLRTVGASAFWNSGLEEFVAPAGLREIGLGAFAGCTGLRRVVLNEGLE